MAEYKIHKTRNYTVMSNTHLRDRNLSLKAKGLLSVMLSLPDDWDYSVNGLVKICQEGISAIESALQELKRNKYLVVTRRLPNETQSGRIEYDYDIYEQPYNDQREVKQPVEKQGAENQPLEKRPQLNINKLNTKESNTKEQNKEDIYTPHATHSEYTPAPQKSPEKKAPKHKYGEFANVLLTDDEHAKLIAEPDGERAIQYLSEYIEMKGYKAKSHYLAIRKWVFDALKEEEQRRNRSTQGFRPQGEERVTIGGKEYIKRGDKYYIPGGSGIAVDPYMPDDLPY